MNYGIMHKGNKKEVTNELIELLALGPKFSTITGPMTEEEAKRQYRLWAATWILPDLKLILGIEKRK